MTDEAFRLTPLDIRRYDFGSALRGYDKTRVDQFRDPGLFNVYATAAPGVEPRRVEDVIHDELTRAAEDLKDEEVAKAKRQIAAHVAYERDGTHNVAMQMSEAEAVADWRFYNSYAKNVSRVTAEDVRRVAALYFTEDNRTVGHFIPKSAGGASNADGANEVNAASDIEISA